MKRLLILLALVGCGGEYRHVEPEPQAYLEQSIVTAEQFSKVKNGMTVAEVSEIMGRDGETVEVKAGTEHVWNNSDGSFASVLFVDGNAKEKVNFQLK